MRVRLLTTVHFAAALLLIGGNAPALAQSSPGYFMPPTAQAPAPAATRATRPSKTRVPRQAIAPSGPPIAEADVPPEPDPQQPMPNLPQPPVPALPPVAKGAASPVAVVGVLGVPDVMKQSSAAQIIEKIIGGRKERLRVDVERAQATWKDMARQLQADSSKLTPEQGRAREQALRARVEGDRRVLQNRNRIIQEAAQISLGQVERTLIAVIRQVADSRGMNLVLHRSQVALNVQEFDVTDAVVQQLNKVLPTVQIVDEAIDPATLPRTWGSPPIVPSATSPTLTGPAPAPAH